MLSYIWENESLQKGFTTLTVSSETAEGSFADSWHMSSAVMHLKGLVEESSITLKGFYSVEGYPDWSWRIKVSLNDDLSEINLEMTNISPEGEGEWAVSAKYSC